MACGGDVDGDGVLRPTVLTGVTPDMEVCAREVFGPVVGVATYRDFDEALRLANDTRYGLQAGVFTNDLGKALQAARIARLRRASWSTRSRRGGPTRCPTAACATAATPARARPTPSAEMTERRLIVMQP